MYLILVAIFLTSLFINFIRKDSMTFNVEQLKGLLLHQDREYRVNAGKPTFIQDHQSMAEKNYGASEVSIKPEELTDTHSQFKNETASRDSDEVHDIKDNEENIQDEEYNTPNTKRDDEDELHDIRNNGNNENKKRDAQEAKKEEEKDAKYNVTHAEEDDKLKGDNDRNVGQYEGNEEATVGNNRNGRDKDDQGTNEKKNEIQDKISHKYQTARDANESSGNAKRNGKATDSNTGMLTTPSLSKVLSSTFIPVEPDTVPVGQSPDIPKRFLIEEADYCKRRPKLQIIAYIHSSILRVKQRNETRSSWANASAYNMGPMNVSIGVVFMVGRAKNELERLIIQEESKKYHDIVQGDYGDHYRLLTYKGLAGLYWINQHCAHVPWTLHSDDDTHIDIFLYHQALRQLDEESKQKFICSHMYGPALRYGRYKVRYEEYPARDYPLYCSGGVWFLQTRFIPRLLEARKTVPYLWVDDAYITGLLARRAGIGHLPFQRYYGGPHVHPEKLGKEVAWFVKFAPRSEWWQKIVDYHRNHSMQQPATLPH
ncbi:uncharacterized protein LOC135116165 isoform X2 [Scylla paramamosain]